MKKSMISIILVFSLLVVSCIPAVAKDFNSFSDFENLEAITKVSNNEKAVEVVEKYVVKNEIASINAMQVVNDLENFEDLGFNAKCLSINEDSIGNNIIYEFTNENGSNALITIKEKGNGNIVLNFKEDELNNTLEITKDKKMYLDGNEVVINVENEPEETTTKNMSITPYASGESMFRHNPPYKGSASNYTKYITTYSKVSLHAGGNIKNIGSSALAAVICGALKASGFVGIYVSVLVAAATGVKNVVEQNNTNSEYLSYKVEKYQYVVSNTSTRYYMYTGTYYGKSNYAGSPFYYTFFEQRVMS